MEFNLYIFGETRVIILYEIQSKLAELKELIEQRANHPYLVKHIDSPLIDEDKLLLLILIFEQLNLADIETNTYITATMLIQLALDTHDYVRSNSIEEDLKSQQLTVLAGDYFSGLYYKHLSEFNNVSLIRELSKGVKEINEHKIMVYEQFQFNDIGQILNSFKVIEGALFEKLANFFQVNLRSDFTLNFLLVKRLLLEKNQLIKTGSSIGFEAIKKLIFDKDDLYRKGITKEQQQKDVLLVFDRVINQAIHLMTLAETDIPHLNELLKSRIHSIVNQHQAMINTFVEEG